MKREIVILTTTTLCLYLLSFSFATGAAEIDARNEKDKIKLEMDVRDLRSATATEVSAHIDGDMITVETTNHAGNPILVEIFDDHGALRAFAESACGSYAVVDISSLPPGQYEIAVTLDYRYKGRFER